MDHTPLTATESGSLNSSAAPTIKGEKAAAMRVVWSTDDHFVKPTLVSILSLLEHATRNVAVHVMGHRLSGGALDLLGRVEDAYPGTTFEHIPIEDGMIPIDGWLHENWTPVSMARLLLPQFFDDGRVLYLDSDTLVLDDVAPLFDICMGGKLIAAARDARTMEFRMWRDADTDGLVRGATVIMKGHPITDYVNSGVILLDCGGIIRSGFDAHMVQLMKVGITSPYPDQDTLNFVFKGRVEIVGQEWNVHNLTYRDPETQRLELHSMRRHLTRSPRTRIRHFTGLGPRPWKRVARNYFEDVYLLELGRDALLYRVTASRLLEKALGEGADVMAEFDFQSPSRGRSLLPARWNARGRLNRAASPHKFIREQISLPHALIRNQIDMDHTPPRSSSNRIGKPHLERRSDNRRRKGGSDEGGVVDGRSLREANSGLHPVAARARLQGCRRACPGPPAERRRAGSA